MKTTIKRLWHRVSALLVRDESLSESKAKWNRFGTENPRYFVFTKQGESINEASFRTEGERDYKTLVAGDPFLQQQLASKERVLEIGCGAGRITEFFAKDFGEVWGIDISESMIKEAQHRLRSLSNMRLLATDGTTIPAPADYFDLVFSFIVFQHMPSEAVVRRNMEEIARVLKPGGVAKIQLRGVPIARSSEFYGPSFDAAGVARLFAGLPLVLLKEEGAGQKYYWITFNKA